MPMLIDLIAENESKAAGQNNELRNIFLSAMSLRQAYTRLQSQLPPSPLPVSINKKEEYTSVNTLYKAHFIQSMLLSMDNPTRYRNFKIST